MLLHDVTYIEYDDENEDLFVSLKDEGEVSDGYHTFNELYEHRHVLFVWLCRAIENNPLIRSYKTRKSNDGKADYEGYFIAWIEFSGGQISYHLPNEYWDLLPITEKERYDSYDDHSSKEAIQKVLEFLQI